MRSYELCKWNNKSIYKSVFKLDIEFEKKKILTNIFVKFTDKEVQTMFIVFRFVKTVLTRKFLCKNVILAKLFYTAV